MARNNGRLNQEVAMSESKPDKPVKAASTPDELVKDLDAKLSEEEKSTVKGGDSYSFGAANAAKKK
jgi:hypothetical protein